MRVIVSLCDLLSPVDYLLIDITIIELIIFSFMSFHFDYFWHNVSVLGVLHIRCWWIC